MLWDKNAINQVLAQLGLGNLDALDNATVRAQLDYANQCDLNIFIVAYAVLLYHAVSQMSLYRVLVDTPY